MAKGPAEGPIKGKTATGSLANPKIEFLPAKVGIKMTGEDKGQYLEVDLEAFFERQHRQGWAGIEIKKL